jgi:hypothetical protein
MTGYDAVGDHGMPFGCGWTGGLARQSGALHAPRRARQ